MLLHGYLVHLPQHSVQANRNRNGNVTLLRILQNSILKELTINSVTPDQSADATHWFCQTRPATYDKTGNLPAQSYFGQRQFSGQCNSHKLKGNSSLHQVMFPECFFPWPASKRETLITSDWLFKHLTLYKVAFEREIVLHSHKICILRVWLLYKDGQR